MRWCELLLLLCAMGAGADQLEGAVGQLVAETAVVLKARGWTSFFLPEISLSLVVVEKGYPQEGRFRANGGSLRDLTSLRPAGPVQAVRRETGLQLQVPLDFGQLHAKYNQYFFKFGLPTYVGTFTTTFNKTFASAVLSLSGSETSCNVTVERAQMDTFGQTSTDIKSPPALVSSLDKVEEAVVGAFFRSLPVLEEFLTKALQEAASKVNLCSLLQQK